MKFTCLRIYLVENLTAIERVIEKNSALPILQNILLKTDKGRIFISATNLEIGVHTSFQAKVLEEGLITIPARTLLNFLQYIKDEKITIQTKETTVFIESQTQKTEIKGLDAKDYPIIPELKEGVVYTVQGDVFITGLISVGFLTATGEIRPELAGVFVSFEHEQIRIAATDSFRLGECVLKTPVQKKETQCIIPSKTVMEFVRIFSGVAEIDIHLNTNQILFKTPDKELISRLIERKYPDYTAIIPTTFVTRAYLKKTEFIQLLRAAGVFSGKNQDVKIRLVPERNKCSITSKNTDVGEYAGEMGCEGQGKELAVTCNYQYFLDALTKLEDEVVSLEGNRETDPILLKDSTRLSTRYLIMPLRSY